MLIWATSLSALACERTALTTPKGDGGSLGGEPPVVDATPSADRNGAPPVADATPNADHRSEPPLADTTPSADHNGEPPVADATPSADRASDAAVDGPPDASAGVGRWLAFAGSHMTDTESGQLFGILLGEGIGELKVLADNVGDAIGWSADGRFLAYAVDSEVRILESVGADLILRRTLVPASQYSVPRWSPVGAVLAWNGAVDGQAAMLLCDVGNGKEPVVVGVPRLAGESVQWSPDGRYLILALPGTDAGLAVPALVDTWETPPVARPLIHSGDPLEGVSAGLTASLSPDGFYIDYSSANPGGRWVVPFSDPSSPHQVADLVWLTSGGFVETNDPSDIDASVRRGQWIDGAWDLGPFIPVTSLFHGVSVAGYVVTDCDAGLCVGRVEDGQLAPWSERDLFIENFSPDGTSMLASEQVRSPIGPPQFEDKWILYRADLDGEWGNLTKIAEYLSGLGSSATVERWSPTSDAFVVTLEGGSRGVLAWRTGDQALTLLAEPDPDRLPCSIGAWAPGGHDFVMSWGDEFNLDDTNVYVFRIDEGRVSDRAAFPGFVRPTWMFQWRWQPMSMNDIGK